MSLLILSWVLLVILLAIIFLTMAIVYAIYETLHRGHLEQLKLDADESLRNTTRDSLRNARPSLYVEH